jgi:hypothetical protein
MLTVAPAGSEEITSFPGWGGICGKSIAGHSKIETSNIVQDVQYLTSISPH